MHHGKIGRRVVSRRSRWGSWAARPACSPSHARPGLRRYW